MSIYVVKEGDSVDSIASRFRVSTDQIIYDNQLIPPYTLAIGQALYIINRFPSAEIETRVNGYAYPFIELAVLQQTLPYLTALSIFSYSFTDTGELNPPQLDDTLMITSARANNCIPYLTLTPLQNDSSFNNNLVTSVVNNPQYIDNLIQNVLSKMNEKQYGGIDIDFEYVKESDRLSYAEFVEKLQVVMNSNSYEVSIALSPKISDTESGILYEGEDYRRLGKAADHVLIMTYDYGYQNGPSMAVSPINKVREAVEYAITKIPRSKINIGIANYGYDWPLPFEKGITAATVIGNVDAVRLAVKMGAEIKFDTAAQSPYFNYVRYGVEHVVWFEDVRSIQSKFNLVKEYGLEGMGYWQIDQLFRANWLLLDNEFEIEKRLV